MFLSIVIPVYNAEKTVMRCLDSIWSQGLPEDDFEVICVDDCSTDNSVNTLKVIADKHPQLSVLRNHENLRAGGARNHGVREARGEYILFIDADDYFHPGGLKEAYDYQKKMHLDILVCDFARHAENNPNDTLVHNFKSQDVMTGGKFLTTNSLPYAPWKYVFRRSLMIENDVFFTEKVSCEDVDWSHRIALYSNRMQYRPILLIHYLLDPMSQTGSGYKKPSTVFHWLKAGERIAAVTQLCHNMEEAENIMRVANETMKNGLKFYCGLFSNPFVKAKMIRRYVSDDYSWNSNITIIRKLPLMYGFLSTLVSPIFRAAVVVKRKFFGR